MKPQWPWLVYSQLQTSVITSSLRHLPLDGADGALHDAVVGVRARRHLVLGLGQSEQHHAADPSDCTSAHSFTSSSIDSLIISGHRADLAADAFARADEQRQDELSGIEARLPHQIADGFGGAQAAETMGGEGHSSEL